MKILDIKLETVRLQVHHMQEIGGKGFGFYGEPQADAALFLATRDSTSIRVHLTPTEEQKFRALFEEVNGRLKGEES